MKKALFVAILLALFCSCVDRKKIVVPSRSEIYSSCNEEYEKRIDTQSLSPVIDSIFLQIKFGMSEKEYCDHLNRIIGGLPMFNSKISFREDTLTGLKVPIKSKDDPILYQFFPEDINKQLSSSGGITELIAVQIVPIFDSHRLVKLKLINYSYPSLYGFYESRGITKMTGYTPMEFGLLSLVDEFSGLYQRRYGEPFSKMTLQSYSDTSVATRYEPYWIIGNLLIEIHSNSKNTVITYSDRRYLKKAKHEEREHQINQDSIQLNAI